MDKSLSWSVTSFALNGTPVQVDAEPGERLSHALRERLDSRDVKVGCNAGDCGACTVLVDDAPVCACLMPVQQASGARVDTLAGLVRNGDPDVARLMDSFQAHQAAQCGICTPGMIVSAVALLRDVPRPDVAQVQDALGGVLCRCTGYRKIIDAVVGAHLPQMAEGSGDVGTSIRRLDGAAKVSGADRFSDDVAPVDALVLRIIRSPFAHASFQFGDLNGWRPDGVEAVLTADDIPGLNLFGVIPGFIDQPVFANSPARFRGEAVAAVVLTVQAAPHFDPASFPVTWSELPAIMDTAQALRDGATQLHPGYAQNIMCGGFVQCGDAADALQRADITVSGHFETGFVEHAYIEPEAGLAYMDGDRVVVQAGTQAPVMDQDTLMAILSLPRNRIRVVPTAVGGGFGSKIDVSVQPFLALAAMRTGRPVRITYSRIDSMQSTTKRHPARIDMTIGAMADGTLCGMNFQGDFNTGAYASWGPTVANRVPIHASGPYRVTDYRAQSRAIYTHCVPSGAFRGFGVPQSAIAQESLFDDLADRLGIDALDFRLRNVLDNNVATVCGQTFDTGVGIRQCLTALRVDWDAEKARCAAFNAENQILKRGVGIAAGWYGCGNTSLPNPSTFKAGIRGNGQVLLHQGAMDIGQGSNTVMAQIFARALGVPVAAVTLLDADTDITPDAGKTSASRQTFVSGNAARLTGEALRADILRRANASDAATLTCTDGTLIVQDAGQTHRLDLTTLDADAEGYVLRAQQSYDPPTTPMDANGQGAPYAQYGYAAHLAVVEVDTALGTTRVLRIVAAHDVGQAINPLLVEGQVQGGVAQGLGMALMEEFIPGRTENLHDYLIPTIGDIPPIDTHIIEVPDAHGPYGAKGLGEHALIPTAPAILNAIRHATGVRVMRVPVTPARLRAALTEAGHA